MTKTKREVMDFQAEIRGDLDGHDESKEWEDFQLGNYDALDDILNSPTHYSMDNLKETIMKFMGYLRGREWYEGEGPYPPGWRFWDEHFGGRFDSSWVWKCPECDGHRIEIRGHNTWIANQNQYGKVLDIGERKQLIVNLRCLRCGHEQHISDDIDLEGWKA